MASDNCDCPIGLLLKRPFKSMKLEERLLILEKGKPTPDLKLRSTFSPANRRNFTRTFNPKLFDILPWLCGCEAKKKLFCWPCLLFGKEETIWSTTGYDNLQNFAKSERRHESSSQHIIALKEMKKFTKVFRKSSSKSKSILSEAQKQEIELHNLKVQKNRFAFKHLTKVVGSLGKLGIDLECDEAPPLNKLYLEELLRLVSSYSPEVKFFMLENNDSIMSKVKTIPGALTECLISEIKREVSQATYLSLILDGVTDSSNKDYVCVSLRYIKHDGEPVERLVRYWEMTTSTDSGIFDRIQQVLVDFNCTSKLVSYSYDNAVVKPADIAFYMELNERMTRMCKNVVYVNYHAHDLAHVLLKSVSSIESVRLFLAALSTFGDFFSRSKKRLEYLKKFQENVLFEWDNPLQLAECVLSNRLVLLNFLLTIAYSTNEWEASAVSEVSNMLRLMRDFDFYFLLSVFSAINKQCKALYQGFLSNLTQPQTCILKAHCFNNFLTQTRSMFNNHLNDAMQTTPKSYRPSINAMVSATQETDKVVYQKLYQDILERMSKTIDARFKNYDKLEFFCLLDRSQFKSHHLMFPQKAICRLLDYYPYLFNPERLKNELTAIYSDLEFRSVYNLHGYISFQELEDVFPETLKLSRMLWTMPLTVQPTSCTARVRDFVNSNSVSKTIFMRVERDLLEDLLEQDRFLEKVVDKLAVKEKRYDILHKSLNKEEEDDLESKPGASMPMLDVEPSLVVDTDSQDSLSPGPPNHQGASFFKMEEEDEHMAMTCDIYPVSPQAAGPLSAETESSESNGSLFLPAALIKEEPVSSGEES